MDKIVAVFGASANPDRYSYKATKMLQQHGYQPLLFSKAVGQVDGLEIAKGPVVNTVVDTATIYVSPRNQAAIEEQVLSLHPKRVIFNPGAENATFANRLEKAGIKVVEACTLVLLRTGQF